MVNYSYANAPLVPHLAFVGAESILIERGISRVKHQAKEKYNSLEIVTIAADNYGLGELAMAASPSLFEEPKMIILGNLKDGKKHLFEDILKYLQNPTPAVHLVLWGQDSSKYKQFLTASTKFDLLKVECPMLKKQREKIQFLVEEVKNNGGRIEPEAAVEIVNGLSIELAEMAAIASQLALDGNGVVTATQAKKYVGGRQAANGFQIADAVIAKDSSKTIVLLRQALETGVAPVLILAALVSRFSLMAKMAHGTPFTIGGAPWQKDQAKRDLRRYTDRAVAQAIEILAQADYELKGGGRTPEYALEKACLKLANL